MTTLDHIECLEAHRGDCQGEVAYHSIDPGRQRGFPRCDKHWEDRLDRRENSIERYADSDTPPAWFDPSYAGERWDEDY